MGAVGIGLVFIGYGVAFTGYILLKGYDIPLAQIWNPLHYYQGTWPPPAIPADQFIN